MARSSMWDGTQWVSMTGGAGDGDGGGGEPDDDYLRLDGANNPASPNDFIRSGYVDGKFLLLTGGSVSGEIFMRLQSTRALIFDRPDTPNSEWYLGMNTAQQMAWRWQGAAIFLLDPNEVRLYKPLAANGQTIRDCAAPTGGNHVGTRDYNDGRYSLLGHSHSYLPLSGGTMTGALTLTLTGVNAITFARADSTGDWWLGDNSASQFSIRWDGRVTFLLASSGQLSLEGGLVTGGDSVLGYATFAQAPEVLFQHPGGGGVPQVRNIIRSTALPTTSDGIHGDIFVQY